jgi:hypothetical protein
MTRDVARAELHDLAGLIRAIAGDAERLLEQHAALVRSELREGLRQVPVAAAEIGAGAVLAATGGLLGAFMIVHGLHRSTRVPLWACYGLVGGALGTAGYSLIARGARRASSTSLVPRETIGVLREDIAWLKDQVAPAEG